MLDDFFCDKAFYQEKKWKNGVFPSENTLII